MEDEGYVFINRDIRRHWLWSDATRLRWWLDLLMMAAQMPESRMVRGEVIRLECGQLLASIRYLAGRWNVNFRTVGRFINALEIDRLLTRKVTHQNSIITIHNFKELQEMFYPCVTHQVQHGIHHEVQQQIQHKVQHEVQHEVQQNKGTHAGAGACADTYIVEKNNIEYNIPSFLPSKEEKNFFKILKSQEMWKNEVAKKFNITVEEVDRLIDEYNSWATIYEKKFESIAELKTAFARWQNKNVRMKTKGGAANGGTKQPKAERGGDPRRRVEPTDDPDAFN